jgi:N-acetyl-beta-hexosaminidase
MGIELYPNAPTPVRHAAQRLAAHVQLPLNERGSEDLHLSIQLTDSPPGPLGAQGYRIASTEDGIVVSSHDSEGVTNGIYTLLRQLMIENRHDPFEAHWDIVEEPRFSIRGMCIAPYRFGGSFGFSVLSGSSTSTSCDCAT